MSLVQPHSPVTIRINGRDFPIWPNDQNIQSRGDKVIYMTRFADSGEIHPSLIDKMSRFYDDPSAKRLCSVSSAGTKIHGIGEWGFPEADLINARAIEFYKRIYGHPQGFVHISWGNFTRQGEYSMPHTHPDCQAVIVYMLDKGESNPLDPLDGQLSFVDSRYEACCRDVPGFMTSPFMPKMQPGSMIIFPANLVHGVNPYQGKRPRLTFSWDLVPEYKGRPRVMEEIDREYGDEA